MNALRAVTTVLNERLRKTLEYENRPELFIQCVLTTN